MTWKILSEEGDYTGNTWNLGIDTAGTFTLLTAGTTDAFVAWGDGTSERMTGNSLAHTYPSSGAYTIQIQNLSGDFRPFYNSNVAGDELTTLGDTPAGWSFGTNLTSAFFGSNNLTTVGDIDTSSVEIFTQAWRSCPGLTSFPLIDTSIGTSFASAWQSCTTLDNITALGDTYSFPLLNISSGEAFTNAWRTCSSLTDFPANFFDSWTATPDTNCFVGAWDACSSLTATGVANILNSIDTSGQSGPVSGFDITIDYKTGEDISAVLGSGNAVDNLTGYISGGGKGWTVTLNGTLYS